MKWLLSSLLLLSTLGLFGQNAIVIPPLERVEIVYPDKPNLCFKLDNASAVELEVEIIERRTGEKIGGFGLSARGNVEVDVPNLAGLRIGNPNLDAAKLRYTVFSRPEMADSSLKQFVNFTLRNETLRAIPLLIPGVMNPNLSPASNSGVTLALGQEIQFRNHGRTYVLFTVDEGISEGQVLNIGEILAERKAALGL